MPRWNYLLINYEHIWFPCNWTYINVKSIKLITWKKDVLISSYPRNSTYIYVNPLMPRWNYLLINYEHIWSLPSFDVKSIKLTIWKKMKMHPSPYINVNQRKFTHAQVELVFLRIYEQFLVSTYFDVYQRKIDS